MTNEGQIKIAICGGFRSGKDTVGDMLKTEFNAEHFAFSDGIWKTIELLFPVKYAERHVEKPRYLLQTLGQKMREIYGDVWIDYTLNRVSETDSNIVITDVRQPNEFEALRWAGFKIIRVNTFLENRIKRAKQAGDNFDENSINHETEQYYPLFDVDYDIDNNWSIADLEIQVHAIVKDLQGVEMK